MVMTRDDACELVEMESLTFDPKNPITAEIDRYLDNDWIRIRTPAGLKSRYEVTQLAMDEMHEAGFSGAVGMVKRRRDEQEARDRSYQKLHPFDGQPQQYGSW